MAGVLTWTGEKPRRPSIRPVEGIHRMPPSSMEGECGVLGSILYGGETRPNESAEAMLQAQDMIGPQHFYVAANRAIWEVLVSMFEQKKPLHLLALTQELRDRNLLDSVGGAPYVSELATYVATSASIEYYLDVMREKFILREIITVCTEAVRRAYEEQDAVNELLDEVQRNITAIALDRSADSPLKRINEVVFQVVEDVKMAHKHRGRTTGLATGFLDLDRMTSGLQPGELIVIAARPSMGKTSFVMNIVQHVATPRVTGPRWDPTRWKYPGYPVAVFSLETSRYRLVRRMVSGEAHVSLSKMKDGFLRKKEEIPRVEDAGIRLEPLPVYIDETPSLRIYDFKARARYAVVKLGVKLIAIDYVQLMMGGGKRDAENAYERSIELTRISASLKTMARELNVPIIAIAQLNRESEKKGASGRPRMSQLRECGALEQDADFVGLLWREEFYEDDEQKRLDVEGEVELIVAKQKDGPTNTVKLVFLKEYTRFENRAGLTDMYSNDPEDYQEGYREEDAQDEV
jgi:replicative DNA helicase